MNSAEEAIHLRHVPPIGSFHPHHYIHTNNNTNDLFHNNNQQFDGYNAPPYLGNIYKGAILMNDLVDEALAQGAEQEEEEDLNGSHCHYEGTDYLEVKIILIGLFASGIALISFLLNAFLVLVFALNPKLRRSPLFYFGVLAMLDLALALLYLALMAVPVYMDKFHLLWLYHLFIHYLRPMLTLSNFAMFASVLMILLATTERLLLTFSGKKINKARRLLERHRPQVTLLMMTVAGAYKLCTYFEIEVAENVNCTGFEQFEVVSAVHEKSPNPMFTLFGWDNYKFWFMFVIRNLVDHILPFFLLVILNFHIVRALRRERLRATQHLADALCSSAAPPLVSSGNREKNRRRGSIKSLRESIRNKVRLRNRLQKVSAGTAEDQAQKKTLRAATRALISVVSMYLMSKVLQVAITFFETFASEDVIMEANFGKFRPLYSYVNDTISILTLLSSALRFPVYCACNKPMLIASKLTLRRILHIGGGSGNSPSAASAVCQQRGRGRTKKPSSSSAATDCRNGPSLLLLLYEEKEEEENEEGQKHPKAIGNGNDGGENNKMNGGLFGVDGQKQQQNGGGGMKRISQSQTVTMASPEEEEEDAETPTICALLPTATAADDDEVELFC